jgi:flagellar hook assembly protein FlgD
MLVKAALAACLLAGSVSLVLADSDKVAPAGSMSPTQVTSSLQSQGYTVSKIKFDDGNYKVKAIDASGHKQKLAVNAQTGTVVSKGDDDDKD